MKVLVAGANGNTGRRVVSLLGKNGFEPYAMVRKKEQMEKMSDLGGKPVLGDLEEDLGEVVKGMDAIIFAAGSGGNTGPEKTIDIDQNGAIKLIQEAENKGVPRFIMLSAISADNPSGGPEKLQHYLEAKHNADEALKASNLLYTILRPGTLNDDPSSGIRAAASLDDPTGQISRQDVAKALVECLNIESTQGKIIEMQGGNLNVQEALLDATKS
ncbi:SDR family oxidoreductase [Roseivirga sp. BDSF3-8]|uniref:SDR family oxidoreductase n=1 Tax=Roseivirga sp. BDSF3-8 TaxID=3241598 RepID=UPI003531D9CC